jgi:hypothetical protein
MHRTEFLTPALGQDADEVDHMIGPDHRLIDRLAEPQIGLNGLNLADIAKRLEMSGKVGAAAGDADAIAAPRQRAHDVPSYESRPTENDHEFGSLQDFCHDGLRLCAPAPPGLG